MENTDIDTKNIRNTVLERVGAKKAKAIITKIESEQEMSQELVAFVDWDKMSAGEMIAVGEQLLNEGNGQAAEQFLLRGAEKVKGENNPELQCAAFGLLGHLYRDRGNFSQAMTLYQQGLNLAKQLGNRRFEGTLYDQIGSMYFMQRNWSEAIAYFTKGLQEGYYGDEADLAVGYGNLGNVYAQQGNFEQAIEAYKKSLDYSIKIGADHLTANQYGNLGLAYSQQSQYDLAIELYHKSLKIKETIGDRHGAATFYSNLGHLYRQQGAQQQAHLHFQRAKTLYESVGDARGAYLVMQALQAVNYKQEAEIMTSLENLQKRTNADSYVIFTEKPNDRFVQFSRYNTGQLCFNFPVHAGFIREGISVMKITRIKEIPKVNYTSENEVLSIEEVERLTQYLDKWNLPYKKRANAGQSSQGDVVGYMIDIQGDLTLPKEKFPEFVHGIFQQVYLIPSNYYLEIAEN